MAAIGGILLPLALSSCVTTAQTAGSKSSGVESGLLAAATRNVDEFMIVDCQLPGQIRQLGTMVTYVSRRPVEKTSARECQIRGGEYVVGDAKSALELWKPVAEEGDPKAQTYVGEIYEKGVGVAPDYAQAAEWYRKAAEQGHQPAQINLGQLYEQGLGVPKDQDQAFAWYSKAAGVKVVPTSELEAKDKEIARLREQVKQAEDDLKARDQQLRRQKTEAQTTVRTVSTARKEVGADQQVLREQQRRLESERRRLEQLRREGEQLAAEQVKRRKEIAAARGLSEGERVVLDELNRQAAAKQAEIAGLQARLDQQQATFDQNARALADELARERQRLEELRRERERQEAEHTQQRRDIAAARGLSEREQTALEDTNREAAAKQAEIAALHARLARLKMDFEENQRTLAQQRARERERLEQLRQERARLEAERNKLRQEIATARGSSEQEQGAVESMDQLLSAKKTEIANLQVQLDQQQATLDGNTRSLTEQLDREQRRLEQLKGESERLEAEQAKLQREVAAARGLSEREQAALAGMNREAAAKQAEIAALQARLDQQQATFEQNERTLAQQLASERERLDQLRGEGRSLTAEQAKLRQDIAEARGLSERERAALEKMTQQAAAKEAEIASLQAQLDQRNEALKQTERVLDLREQEIARQQARLEKLHGEIKLRQADRDRLEEEMIARQRQLVQVAQIRGPSGTMAAPSTTPSSPPPLPPVWRNIDFGSYYALVIGNDGYRQLPRLETAATDARDIARLLESKYGFRVTTLMNATRHEIMEQLNAMRENLTEKDNLLIYYAGHGEIDRRNQRGYWLPIDAEPDSNANWVSNVTITDIIKVMSARHVMVVADSCYSGSLTRSALARLEAGMSSEARLKWIRSMVESSSRTALTSGGDAPVVDNVGGKHSIFAQALIEALSDNRGVLEAQRLFRNVTSRVTSTARKYGIDQVPQYAPIQYSDHGGGDFFFVPSGA